MIIVAVEEGKVHSFGEVRMEVWHMRVMGMMAGVVRGWVRVRSFRVRGASLFNVDQEAGDEEEVMALEGEVEVEAGEGSITDRVRSNPVEMEIPGIRTF